MKNIVLSGCLKVSPECRPVQLTVPFNLSQQRLFQSIWDPRYLKFLELLMVEFIFPEELVDGHIQWWTQGLNEPLARLGNAPLILLASRSATLSLATPFACARTQQQSVILTIRAPVAYQNNEWWIFILVIKWPLNIFYIYKKDNVPLPSLCPREIASVSIVSELALSMTMNDQTTLPHNSYTQDLILPM